MLSMTGFGNGEVTREGRKLTVVINSVNRKQLDMRVTLPRELLHREPDVRTMINSVLSRGMVTVLAEFDGANSPTHAGINVPLAKSLWNDMQALSEDLGLEEKVTLSDLLQLPEIFLVGSPDLPQEELDSMLDDALAPAIAGLISAREKEGAALKVDLEERRKQLLAYLSEISTLAPRVPKLYRERLMTRIQEIEPEIDIDDERLMKEVLYYADKSDITEETTRLGCHLEQMGSLFESEAAVGRKLDFLIQEMVREINTIGSKCSDKDIASLVVDFKSELEKVREQIQNIE